MKLVRESLLEFTRSDNPLHTMGIGRRALIDKWFREANISPGKYTVDKDFNIYVEGSLYLENTLITSLPDNLTVGGYLHLSNTQITSLPKSLKVKGEIYQ